MENVVEPTPEEAPPPVEAPPAEPGDGALETVLNEKVADSNRHLMSTEDFIAAFDAEQKEPVTRYAQKFANENGNLDVQKMLKSGYHLESKFGGFTGAPDDYSIPTPEGLSGDVDLEDPYLKEFMASAKELNMSQDGFEKIMDIHLRASVAPPLDVEVLAKEIGFDFESMRSNMAGYFKSRLSDDEFNAVNGLINSPDTFRALYSVYKSSRPTKVEQEVATNFNQSELKMQMEAEYHAKDDRGNPRMQDQTYANSWRKRWEPFIQESDM